MEQFDAIIIGTGQAGKPLAKKLAQEGLRTAVIERSNVGGSCVNWGCTPTKTMVASANVNHLARTAEEVGIKTGPVSTDYKKVIERRNQLVEKSRESILSMMQETEQLELIYGEARFIGKKELEVHLPDQDETRKLKAEKIFINVGTSPSLPEIEGLEKVDYYTFKSMMTLEELPEHLLILGGNYIGLEYGQMFKRFGSKVSIIEKEAQLAVQEDEDVATALQEILQKDGLDIYLNAELQKVEQQENQVYLHLHGNKTITGSHLLIATGTRPNTEVLQLPKADIETNEQGYIKVNEFLQTGVDGIYALGDCKGGPEFTHISYDDYRIVEDHLFGEKKRSVNNRPVPYILFTKPQLGRVGLNEKEAREKGINYKLASMPAKSIARAVETNSTEGLLKVLIDPENDRLLGASCLAEEGGELMSMLQIAMMGGLRYQQLRDAVLAHPAWAECFNRLFMKIKKPES